MEWFKNEDIPEAIKSSKQKKALLLVYISGTDDLSKKTNATWESEAVGQFCEDNGVIAIQMLNTSEYCKWFAQIYTVDDVPSTFCIGMDGLPIDIIKGLVTPDEFVQKLQHVKQTFDDQEKHLERTPEHVEKTKKENESEEKIEQKEQEDNGYSKAKMKAEIAKHREDKKAKDEDEEKERMEKLEEKKKQKLLKQQKEEEDNRNSKAKMKAEIAKYREDKKAKDEEEEKERMEKLEEKKKQKLLKQQKEEEDNRNSKAKMKAEIAKYREDKKAKDEEEEKDRMEKLEEKKKQKLLKQQKEEEDNRNSKAKMKAEIAKYREDKKAKAEAEEKERMEKLEEKKKQKLLKQQKEEEDNRNSKAKMKAEIAKYREEKKAKAEAEEKERIKKLEDKKKQKLLEQQRLDAENEARRNEMAQIRVRLPDGSFLSQSFQSTDTLQSLSDFITERVKSRVTLFTTYPERRFTQEDISSTFAELQLTPSAAVIAIPESRPNTQDSLASFLLSLAILFQLFQAPLHLIWVFFHSLLVGWRGNIQIIDPQHQPSPSQQTYMSSEQLRIRTNRPPKPKMTKAEMEKEEANIYAAEEKERRKIGIIMCNQMRCREDQEKEAQKREMEDNKKQKQLLIEQIKYDRVEQIRPPGRQDRDMTEGRNDDELVTMEN